MSLTIWQTLGNTFYQGDDSRSIRTGGTRGNSDLDLIAPISFGGKGGSGATGFSTSPGQTPIKLQPQDAAPKSARPQTLQNINRILEEKFGLKTYDARQGKAPSNFEDLSNLGKSTSGTPGRRSLGEANAESQRIANNRASNDAATARRARLNEIGRGSRGATPAQPAKPSDSKASPSAQKSKPAPTAYKEPPERGSFFPFPGLKPESPSPASQPKTGTPSPKNALPKQWRDPRTGKPFPGKPQNQPLGDRPPTGRSIPFTTRPPEGAPITEMFGIPFGNAYNIHGYFRGPFGEIDGTYPAYLNGTYGGDASISVEFAYEYQPNFFNPDLKYWVWDCFTTGYDGNRYAKALSGRITTLKNNRPFYGITEVRCVNCNPPQPPILPQPTEQVAPYQNTPPLKSPKKERPPDFKPVPDSFPVPDGFPRPFPQPQPQPLPAPTEKPQQQPKPDADKEPRKSPVARRNPKPTPRPDVKPIPAPNTSGSGSFPKPDTSGRPEGSGQNQPGNDFNPNPNPAPPSPSPTPNYPEPVPPRNPPKPSSQPNPSPNPNPDPTPDFKPIENKKPNPSNKDPEPVVQFPPFPVEPKLIKNPCKIADPCMQSISSGVDGANQKATDNGKKLKDIADALDKALQVIDLGLLKVINDKLGDQVDGGLSKQGKNILQGIGRVQLAVLAVTEKLFKFAKWARLGQLVSVLTLITTLHNALMLSRNLGETLLSMLSNGLAVFGIRDDNGAAYDLSNLIGNTVETMMKETIGTENYTTLSTNFKKANRIYQAAANLGNSIQSLRFSVVSALETIGGWNARIGNALKRSGVVNESSYAWMNPTPNFDNKFTRALETVENTVSQIDSVASEILSAQETVTQIGNQKTELLNSLGLGTEKPQTENQPQKDKAIAAKAVSVAPNIEATDLNKPGV